MARIGLVPKLFITFFIVVNLCFGFVCMKKSGNYIQLPKILCIGDSITLGVGETTYWAYRDHLNNLLAASSIYDFVGAYSNPIPNESPFRNQHSGVGGEKTYEIEARLQNELDTFFKGTAPVGSKVLIHAGTNDVGYSESLTNARDNIEDMIDIINAHDSTIDVYVALIIPFTGKIEDVETLNGYITTMVTTYQETKSNVYIVDMYTAFTNNASWADEYMTNENHPNDTGYSLMADTWFANF